MRREKKQKESGKEDGIERKKEEGEKARLREHTELEGTELLRVLEWRVMDK